MGIAFQASHAIGLIVAAAVLAHDFADGLNTVNVVTKNGGTPRLCLALAGGGCGGAGAGRGAQPADRAGCGNCWRCCWRCSAASSCISAPAGFCPKATAPIRAPPRPWRPWRARVSLCGDGAGAISRLSTHYRLHGQLPSVMRVLLALHPEAEARSARRSMPYRCRRSAKVDVPRGRVRKREVTRGAT